jgi:hypothetical protein
MVYNFPHLKFLQFASNDLVRGGENYPSVWRAGSISCPFEHRKGEVAEASIILLPVEFLAVGFVFE